MTDAMALALVAAVPTRLTAMLLAEAPVRGVSLMNMGAQVMRRVRELRLDVGGGGVGSSYLMPQQFQGNDRAGDVT